MDKIKYYTGDIYWINLTGDNHIQNGWHPGIIVQNNKGNYFANTIEIVPITSSKKTKLPTHVNLRAGKFGLVKDSVAQCEGQRLICKSQIGSYIGTLDHTTMSKIAKGCLINTPFLHFLSEVEVKNIKYLNSNEV